MWMVVREQHGGTKYWEIAREDLRRGWDNIENDGIDSSNVIVSRRPRLMKIKTQVHACETIRIEVSDRN